jgi:hypothetical protein
MDTITCSGHGDLIKLPVSLGAAARFLLTMTIVMHTYSLFRTNNGRWATHYFRHLRITGIIRMSESRSRMCVRSWVC